MFARPKMSAITPAIVVIRAPPMNSPMDIGMEIPVEVRCFGRDSIGIRLIQKIPIAPGMDEQTAYITIAKWLPGAANIVSGARKDAT